MKLATITQDIYIKEDGKVCENLFLLRDSFVDFADEIEDIACFLEDGDYNAEMFWSEEGITLRVCDELAELLEQNFEFLSFKNVDKTLDDSEIDDEFEELIEMF